MKLIIIDYGRFNYRRLYYSFCIGYRKGLMKKSLNKVVRYV